MAGMGGILYNMQKNVCALVKRIAKASIPGGLQVREKSTTGEERLRIQTATLPPLGWNLSSRKLEKFGILMKSPSMNSCNQDSVATKQPTRRYGHTVVRRLS